LPLEANETYTVNRTFTLPGGAAGSGYLLFKTDSYNYQAETNETDNVYIHAIDIAAPNLTISHANAPIAAILGETLAVTWTVLNNGSVPANADWYDSVYLSNDQILDSSDQYVAAFWQGGKTPLAAETSYTDTQNITISGNVTGDRYLIFVTDYYTNYYYNNQQGETDETDNTYVLPISLSAPDLIISDATAPSIGIVNGAVDVSWQVKNQGTVPAPADWSDYIYLSTDATLSFNDIFITSESITSQTPLLADGSYTISRSINLPNVTAGNYYLIFRADGSQQQGETNESNNDRAVAITIGSPDLIVYEANVPESGALGATVNVAWTVTNQGDVAAPADWSDYIYWSSDDTYDSSDTLITTVAAAFQTPVAAGGSYTQTQTITLPNKINFVGDGYLIFRADGDNLQGETNNNNNDLAVAFRVDAPDLIVSDASAPESVTVGATISISWDVTNQGTVAANADWYDSIYISNDQIFDSSDQYITSRWAGNNTPLAADGTYTATQNITLPSTATGDRYLLFVTDRYHFDDNYYNFYYNNLQSETDETNNVRAVAINISASDLQVTATNAPTAAVLGETVELTWTVSNQGTGTATRDWYDRVYLSSNQTLDSSDVLVTSEWISAQTPLAAGADYTISKNVVLPSFTPGNQYLLFVADRDNYQAEIDENNNVAAVAINLSAPDLIVSNASAPQTGTLGKSIEVSWTVENQGITSASADWYDHVYLSNDQVFDANADTLVTQEFISTQTPLANGGSYTITRNINLPNFATGDRYLIFVADGSQQQGETDNANNTRAVAISLNAPDLIVSKITAPVESLSGQTIDISWTITNQGVATVEGTWWDRIYLVDASTGTFVRDLGYFSFTGSIAPGASLERGQGITLPLDLTGDYKVAVTTDVYNYIPEGTQHESNNTTTDDQNFKIQLSPVPNLQVSSVTASATAFSSQETVVEWTVTNVGTGATNAPIWYDTVYLSVDQTFDDTDTYLGRATNPSYLNPGDSYSNSLTVTLPRGIDGNYHFLVQTDAYNYVTEVGNEGDNFGVGESTDISLTPPPDLQVTAVNAPNGAFSGQPMNLSWTVTNQGEGRTLETAWWDRVFMSADETLDASDRILGDFYHRGALNADQSYTGSATVNLPVGVAGNFFFFVQSDIYNNVYEHIFENNNSNYDTTATNITLTPPPDLEFEFLIIPLNARSGGNFSINYRVTNFGATETPNYFWTDTFYLSTDNQFDPATDIQLGSVTQYGILNPGDGYDRTANFTLSNTLTGTYYLFAVTDSDDQVFEINNTNNVTQSSHQVQIVSQPADLVVTEAIIPATGEAGKPISVQWTVKNQGTGDTIVTSWSDRIVASSDGILGDADDITLATFTRTGLLAADDTYTRTETVNLPFSLEGNYQLFVITDAANNVYEGSNEGNNSSNAYPVTIARQTPDLQVTAINLPTTAESGTPITLTWTVENLGVGRTNSNFWYDEVYLSLDTTVSGNDIKLGSVFRSGALDPASSYTASGRFNLPVDINGNYYVLVRTDRDHHVIEGSLENNNDQASDRTTSISLSQVADLTVQSVDAPEQGITGQALNLTWTVVNHGANTGQNWYDAVYLSRDQVFDRNSDIYLGYRNHTGGLNSGDSYTATQSFNIPRGLAGRYYAFVVTDSGNAVYERTGEANNTNFDGFSTEIIIPPPSDLVVTNITVPSSGIPGQGINISYTVQNQGTDTAYGSWTDAVYLSTDTQWDIGDTLVGQVNHSGDIATGASYTKTLNGIVPGVNLGNYHVIVRSDIRNQVPEVNEGNNAGVSSNQVTLDVEALTLDIPDTGNLGQGQSTYYRFHATAGQAIRLKLDSSADQSFNELYVRYGTMPTRGQFDLTTVQPFNADPEIIIPIEQTGTYYILAYGDQVAGTPSYEIVAQDIPFSITDVATDTIGNTGEATLEIRGAKFAPDTIFQLRAADGSLITAENIYLENSTLAYVTFDLFGATVGLYDVQAKESNGSTTILEDIITIESASGYDLDANITGPDEVRPNRNYRFNVNYGNQGNTDAIAPLLIIESATNTQAGTTLDKLGSGAPLHLLGVSNEGPQGILRPGDLNVLPVYFNSNTDPVNFRVRTYSADNTTAINWNSLEASIRPEGLTDTQWDSFLGNIVPRVQTYGDYVKMLNDMSETLSSPDHPIYDARDLFARMYLSNPDYQPSSNLSGQLLDADTGNPVAGVEIGAYKVRGNNRRLAGKTITNEQGYFTISSVESGDYELALGDRSFDMDRDGIVDWQPPSYTIVQNEDAKNITIYAAGNNDQPVHINDANAVLAVSNGNTHILWDRDGKLWHSYFDGTNWVNAIQLTDAAVTNFNLETSDYLINGNSPGLIATWQQGAGNEAEIYYAISRPRNEGGFEWSEPIALTNNSISDANPTLFVTNTGQALFTYLKSDQTIQDDTDLYYDFVDITASSLSQFLSNPEQISTQAAGLNYAFQWSFPQTPKQLPGKIKFQGNLSGQLGLSAGSEQVSGSGQIGAQFTFDGPSLRSSISGSGQIEALWKLNKEECDWIFENATGSWSVGGSFDWKNGIVQLLKLAGPGGYIASLFLDAWLTGLNDNPGGWSIEAGVNVNIGAQFNQLRWTGEEPFPSFLLPDSIGEASLKVGFGPYVQFGYASDAQLKASGYINSDFDVIPNFRHNKTTGGIKFELIYASGHNWSFELSADLLTSSSLATFDSEFTTLNAISPSSTDVPEGVRIEFTYQPERVIGTSNIYGNNSVLANVGSDLYADGQSAITQNADGQIVMAWTKTVDPNSNQVGNQVVVAQFDGSQWSNPIEIPHSIGFNDDIAIINDDENQLLLVWSRAESSNITASLTQEEFLAAYRAQDIYYSLYQNGQWSSPTSVDIRVGSDTDVALGKTANGDVVLAWINHNETANQSTILSAFWNGQNWTNAQTILTTNAVGNLEFSQLDDQTALFWTQDINPDPTITETSLFYSVYHETWLTPVLFSPNLPLTSTSNSTASDLTTSEAELFTQGSIISGLIPIDEELCECKEGDPECDEDDDEYNPPVRRPLDPNDILGPEGFGEDRWIDTDEPFRYTIRFENAASASAPAQEVVITQQLDDDLDWRTFRVDDYGWSGAVYELAGDRAFHSTRIDLTATKGFYVDVAATIDTTTGIATWRISTIDPTTGEAPLEAQAGFLPTNDENGAGEGFVSYSIRAKRTAQTGDVIDAEAKIIFDTEEPINTPPIFNTLDVSKPTSEVNELPATTETPEFLVSWLGTDAGSAIASYTIYVSENGGEFTPWLTDTTLTESTYTGTPGNTYEFYAIATDNAGNTQEMPTAAQATIRVAGGVATIGDFVWLDSNADGIRNPGELGLANVTVNLYNSAANLVTTTTTNANGFYSFTNIPTGDYAVEFVAPTGYQFSNPNQGTDDTIDSDASLTNGRTDIFTANAGDNLIWDGGLYQLASITGQKWHDIDGDGIKDAEEPGLANWTIYLDTNTNGQLDDGETSVITDANGNYSFTNLRPGTYTIAEVMQAGWRQTYPAVDVTTTGADIQLYTPNIPIITNETYASTPGTNLINLNDFWADSRFANIKGQGYATVIIDTGIDLNHPLFGTDANNDGIADKIVYQYDFGNNDNNASDKNNHGSHVASIATSIAPDANLIVLKVFHDNGYGSFANLEKALQWVNANANTYNIASVNLSLGDNQNWNTTNARYGIGDELAAIASQNIIISAAAGNSFYTFTSSPGLAYPAIDPNTISVGAVWADDFGSRTFSNGSADYTTDSDRIASFSQRHPLLDVFAPGILITGANATGGTISMGGTSQAAPFIAGIATLAQQIAQTYLGRELTLTEFRTLLDTTSDSIIDGDDENDNVTNTGVAYPRINVLALAEGILTLTTSTSNPDPVNPSNNQNHGSGAATNSLSLVHTVTLTSGQIASDINFGNQLIPDQSPTVTAPIGDITVDEDADNTVVDLTNVFSDADGDAIATSVFANSNTGLVTATIVGNQLILEYQENQSGTAEITLRGTSNGKFINDTFIVTVNPVDDAPVVQNAIADIIVDEDADNTIIDLTNVFSDVDSPVIVKSVFANSNPTLVTATIDGNHLILDYQPDQFGIANITLRGTADDQFVEDTFQITVNPVNDGPIVEVRSSISYTLSENVANLILTGTSNISGTGNALNNVITGNSGNNILRGEAGNDTLYGGAGFNWLDGGTGADMMVGGSGMDIYFVDNPQDTIIEEADGGIDIVIASISWQLGSHLENLTLTGTNAINGTGNSSHNVLIGNSAGNILSGGNGNDWLSGLGGDDRLLGENGNDTLDGGQGNDILIGGSGSDSLMGGAGDDTLIGGMGNDILTGGSGHDQFVFNSLAEGIDTITDFSSTDDVLVVQTLLTNLNYTGTNPIADGYIRGVQSGSNTLIQIDPDGVAGGASFSTLAILSNFNASNFSQNNLIF
jgi:subtilase family serine protease/protocatechuate 3,4-dioxygenase beta subunit